MTQITKHNSEQERESNDCIQCRIGFSVAGHTIRINQVLESFCEPICSVESWWILIGWNQVQKTLNG